MPSKDCNAGMHLCPTEGGAKPKAGFGRFLFCHLIRSAAPAPRRRLQAAAPSSARFDPTSRIVVGSGVGSGAPGSPASEKNVGGADPPRPPGPPPPVNGPGLPGRPEPPPPPQPFPEPVLSPEVDPARNCTGAGGESPLPLDWPFD